MLSYTNKELDPVFKKLKGKELDASQDQLQEWVQ